MGIRAVQLMCSFKKAVIFNQFYSAFLGPVAQFQLLFIELFKQSSNFDRLPVFSMIDI
jgi:hypothetical protein